MAARRALRSRPDSMRQGALHDKAEVVGSGSSVDAKFCSRELEKRLLCPSMAVSFMIVSTFISGALTTLPLNTAARLAPKNTSDSLVTIHCHKGHAGGCRGPKLSYSFYFRFRFIFRHHSQKSSLTWKVLTEVATEATPKWILQGVAPPVATPLFDVFP